MPTYEMPLLLRIANKAEYKTVIKDVANSIFQTGGFIRKIEHWGNKELPCKANAHGKIHTHAGYFMIYFDVPPLDTPKIENECARNRSIVRASIYKQREPPSNVKCTLEEEMLPPPYRKNVQEIIQAGRRSHTQQFQYNSGLDYHPFPK